MLCVAGKGLNFSRRVWCEQYEPKKSHTRLGTRRDTRHETRHETRQVDRLLIVFFITQIHRVRFVSVNEEASRVKPSKRKFWKVWKKFQEKNVKKKFWKNYFWKKMLEKNLKKKILKKKISKKKISKKVLTKKIVEK